MKREAVGHTKMKRLQLYLDIPQWQAVGILESIWHLTSREAPTGAIGRMSDEEIAIGIDYRGDFEKLFAALIRAGWLDRHPDHRLIIHKWWDHADDTTHAKVARARLWFCDGRVPKLTKLNRHEREQAEQYYSNNTPDSILKEASGIPKQLNGILQEDSQHSEEFRHSSSVPVKNANQSLNHNQSHNQIAVAVESTSGSTGSEPAAAAALNALSSNVRPIRTAPKAEPVPADGDDIPDIDQIASTLVTLLLPNHPTGGSRPFAIKAAQVVLAEAVNPESYASGMRKAHEKFREWWAEQRKREPRFFIPKLDRWISDGDYLNPPAKDNIGTNGSSNSTSKGNKFLERLAAGEVTL